jgi:hypothetical protein
MDWAREHGVRPPEYAIDEARRQKIDLCWLDEPAGSQMVKSCCVAKAGNGKPCCCCHRDDAAQKNSDKAASRVIVWKALACGGQSLNWLAAVPTLIAVSHELSDRLPLVAWLGPNISVWADGIADEPVVPPPERV